MKIAQIIYNYHTKSFEIVKVASRAFFSACFLPCTSRSRSTHSRRLVYLRSNVLLRAFCNFESKHAMSITLFGRPNKK